MCVINDYKDNYKKLLLHLVIFFFQFNDITSWYILLGLPVSIYTINWISFLIMIQQSMINK